ncbi:PREDICTED: alpha-1,3-mannosyl-glycoprotein 4-beta-N-acetylglucosaminyltransferase A-like isoform X2 [Papilio xuthus]|nr:PREDICTED: alpha-1,3-mannosyl-glycoprotein 4-beta-N-acetylglucosaminyltransferase A-like isoform X2 [Papilio xuthus]XP_013179074.1 PREDICTED: alpha-1,3-mannosyl-glycoprotein 4-beta-N-acetylglucosaminyltransferase A-like isoform X2 [Papilio xuthus]
MTHGPLFSRAFGSLTSNPRKRFTTLFVTISIIFFIVFISSGDLSIPREDKMEQSVAEMQTHLQFLDSLYRARLEDLLTLQNKVLSSRCFNESHHHQPTSYSDTVTVTLTPELMTSLKNLSGTKTAQGVQPKNLQLFRTPFVFQLLPHLMNDPNSLRPSYHMKSGRVFVDVVIGVPTVKRDKESYLLITLTHLVNGLTEDDVNSTLIVVFVGETDLEYVVNTARQIEITFPKQVENGLIEVLSPSTSYYPDFDTLEKTLGDSMKRVKWRTKQNLDAIYLMSYAQTKGTFYLMLEDDVIAKKFYMQEIKQFTASTTVSTPNWFFIEYCQVGGIGKLFRSSDLIHFVTYVQLFYNNMPIDWLLESYLADRVCSIDKTAKACSKSKSTIRPKYKTSLFQHIGLYSSLKGKIQKVKDAHFGSVPTYYPHTNPPLESMKTDIVEQGDHTLKRAYEGQTYFWGIKPKKGDMIEFWFEKPTAIKSFTFRSSNVDHATDKFYDTVVEVLPAGTNNFTIVGSFDEFGLADGELKKDAGPFSAIRLRVQSDSFYWVILSEIEIMTHDGTKETR